MDRTVNAAEAVSAREWLTGKPVAGKASAADDYDAEEYGRIRRVLETPRFAYGFKDDSIERLRFRRLYEEANGIPCHLEDGQLSASIRRVGFAYDGKVYAIPAKAEAWWTEYLRDCKGAGTGIVYYEPLYDECFDECCNDKIVSAEMLKEYLASLPGEWTVGETFLILEGTQADEPELLRRELLRVWGDKALRSLEELHAFLPLVPEDSLKWALRNDAAFIWNKADAYALRQNLDLDEDEIAGLIDFIDKECEQAGQVSLENVPLDWCQESNPYLSESALYSLVHDWVADKYERKGKVLSPKGKGRDAKEAVRSFCQGRKRCTYSELQEIAMQATGGARLPQIVAAAQSVMVRVNEHDFVAEAEVDFDVLAIDVALDKMVTDFLGLKEIVSFALFPPCGFAWNLYLLESYCRRFSKKYEYRCKLDNSSNTGAIAVRECPLTYHEMMIHAVVRSGIDISREKVFEFLQAAGYMERRRYSEMDDLLARAEELRRRS